MQNWKLFLSVLICLLAIVLIVALSAGSEDSELRVNDDLTSLADFDVSCDETGTYARGVFFVMQKEKTAGISISADIKVGETDAYGAEFFIPPEFDIGRVLCSFNGDISSEHVCVREWPEGGHFICISQARYYPDRVPVGGEGIVSIDLTLNKNVRLNTIDAFNFGIAVSNNVVRDVIIPVLH